MKFHIPLAVFNSMPNYSNFDFKTQEKREITWYTKKRRVQSAHAKSKIMLESKRKRKERQFIFSSINFSFSISFGHEECWCFYSEITLTFFFSLVFRPIKSPSSYWAKLFEIFFCMIKLSFNKKIERMGRKQETKLLIF